MERNRHVRTIDIAGDIRDESWINSRRRILKRSHDFRLDRTRHRLHDANAALDDVRTGIVCIKALKFI